MIRLPSSTIGAFASGHEAGLAGRVSRRGVLRLLFSAAAVPVVAGLTLRSAHAQTVMDSFELSPGVIVDTSRNRAYVMRPQGGIAAVDLAGGGVTWTSNQGTRPLAVDGAVLLTQIESRQVSNRVLLAALNVADGRLTFASSVELAGEVKALVNKTRGSSFALRARIESGEAIVAWEFVQLPWQGRRPRVEGLGPANADDNPQERSDAGSQTDVQATVLNGAFAVSLRSGRVAELVPQNRSLPSPRAHSPTPATRLPGLPAVQFLSANEQHVLCPERIADDRSFEKYRWSIYDRNTVQLVGQVGSHVSYAPFVVTGSHLIFEAVPSARRTGSGMVREPLQIRAVDMRSGDVLWRQAVRDTTGRGPTPP